MLIKLICNLYKCSLLLYTCLPLQAVPFRTAGISFHSSIDFCFNLPTRSTLLTILRQMVFFLCFCFHSQIISCFFKITVPQSAKAGAAVQYLLLFCLFIGNLNAVSLHSHTVAPFQGQLLIFAEADGFSAAQRDIAFQHIINHIIEQLPNLLRCVTAAQNLQFIFTESIHANGITVVACFILICFALRKRRS